MIARRGLVVVGAGGFAREVRWLIEAAGEAGTSVWSFIGYVVTDLNMLGPHDDRASLLGDLNWLSGNLNDVDGIALGFGTPQTRLAVGAELTERFPTLEFPVLWHPSVTMDWQSAKLARGVILCAGTVGTVNIEIDEFAMVNLDCTLGHEARIGAGSVLNPSVNISGGAAIGEGVLVGTGAQILQYVRIGNGAVVGAGAVATKDVPDGATVVGIPARPLRS